MIFIIFKNSKFYIKKTENQYGCPDHYAYPSRSLRKWIYCLSLSFGQNMNIKADREISFGRTLKPRTSSDYVCRIIASKLITNLGESNPTPQIDCILGEDSARVSGHDPAVLPLQPQRA